MAEKYLFFDSADPVNPDRTYNAEEFTDYFSAIITTGVMQGEAEELKVSASGNNMVSTVGTGIAFINGKYYQNDSPLGLTHDTESIGVNRIDRVVIRLDLNTENRYVRAFVKKGQPSTNPSPPSLQRDNIIYEISLARVFITGGQTYIEQNDIIDERGVPEVCPWATSKIIPDTTDALITHEENNIVHNVDSDDMDMTYTEGLLTQIREYKDSDLVKQTNFTYVNGDLSKMRERYYREGIAVDDFTTTFTYVDGILTNIARSET